MPPTPRIDGESRMSTGTLTLQALWYQHWLPGAYSQPTFDVLAEIAKNKSLHEARCLVTGANSGLGRGIARRLIALGCETTIAVRNPSRLLDAEITREAKDLAASQPALFSGKIGDLSSERIDLGSLSSIANFVEAQRHTRGFHVVILNAGIAPSEGTTTEDGFESALGINYIANFALVEALNKGGFIKPTR